MFLMPLLACAQGANNEDIICFNDNTSAQFPGGSNEIIKFLKENLKYPVKALKNKIEGTVYVRFLVEKDGSINKDCVKVTKSVNVDLDKEAIRVIKLLPKWIPATQNKMPIRHTMRIPVKFKISDFVISKKTVDYRKEWLLTNFGLILD